jgi:hypothetical protein
MRVLWHAGAVLLGAAVSLASVAVYRTAVLQIPVGLVLALAATFSVPWALVQTPGNRRLTTSYAAGWLAVFGLVLFGRPEGDYALAGDFDGYALMAAGFLLVVIGVSSLASHDHKTGQITRRG